MIDPQPGSATPASPPTPSPTPAGGQAMFRRPLVLMLGVLLIALLFGGFAFDRFFGTTDGTAEATTGIATATPAVIQANEPTLVTVTILITDSKLKPNTVKLLRLQGGGTEPLALGSLNDNGTDGDAKAKDKIYTIRREFTEASGPITLQVSWERSGFPSRGLSLPVLVLVRVPPIIAGTLTVTPSFLVANEPATVTATIPISDPNLVPATPTLLRVDETGRVVSILGLMNDLGMFGDATKGDKVFTLRRSLSATSSDPVRVQASWLVKPSFGQRVSNVAALEVWQSLVENDLNVSLAFPAGWDVQPASAVSLELTHPIVDQDQQPVARVTVESRANPSLLPLQDWLQFEPGFISSSQHAALSADAPDAAGTYQESAVTINGVSGIDQTISGSGGWARSVLIPRGASILAIRIGSSVANSDTPEVRQLLAIFAQMLTTVRLTE